ncbi:hypothetical protein V6Z11_A05G222000 [Gossypium hirsutum]
MPLARSTETVILVSYLTPWCLPVSHVEVYNWLYVFELHRHVRISFRLLRRLDLPRFVRGEGIWRALRPWRVVLIKWSSGRINRSDSRRFDRMGSKRETNKENRSRLRL